MRIPSKLAFWRTAGLVAVGAVLVAACGSVASTSHSTAKTGGVVTFAEGPAAPPNYIFPLASGPYFSVTNLSDFSQIMYQPLYWFGKNGEPVYNPQLSIAYAPKFSNGNKTVTIKMKHWKWSDGKPITSRDVIFWMNLLNAAISPAAANVGSSSAPGPGWGAFVSGAFPQNVTSYKATGTYSIQMQLNASYDPTWFLYNELSQIYPLPQHAWDKTSASSPVGNYDTTVPGTATSGALAVAQFINTQSQDTSTYATNPLWKVVDGAFKMQQYTSTGFVKMVPNKNYSGPFKPKVSAFEELPFTTDTAEFNSLRAGDLTIGYIPGQDLQQKGFLQRQGYVYSPWNDFGFTYFPYNFTNPTTGPIFNQLYFRQAFQSLVNQKQYINDFAHAGYATNGPVPLVPKGNPDVSTLEGGKQIYPYNPSKAVSLLKDHGWSVHPGGSTTCTSPGTGPSNCGANIKSGQALNFTLAYASGSTVLTEELQAMKSAMSKEAGITLTLSSEPFSSILGLAFAGCVIAKPCNNWDMADWGGGWVYSPDYFPTGGELFSGGTSSAAGSNGGDYYSPTLNSLINKTHTVPTKAAEYKALFKYEDYAAKNLPVVYMPSGPYQLTMYKKTLSGIAPQGIYDEIYPMNYSLSK